jgi:hypothetical protein
MLLDAARFQGILRTSEVNSVGIISEFSEFSHASGFGMILFLSMSVDVVNPNSHHLFCHGFKCLQVHLDALHSVEIVEVYLEYACGIGLPPAGGERCTSRK